MGNPLLPINKPSIRFPQVVLNNSMTDILCLRTLNRTPCKSHN